MRAFILKLGSPIEPFGDSPAEALILNKPLREVQRETLRQAGVSDVIVEPVHEHELPEPTGDPYLVVADDLCFSKLLVRSFLADGLPAAREGKNMRLVIPECRTAKENAPMQDLVRGTLFDGRPYYGYPMWLVGTKPSEAAPLASAPPLAVDAREKIHELDHVPQVFTSGNKLTIPVSPRVAIRIQHWVHVLRANHLAIMAGVSELGERPKIVNVFAILWLLLRTFPLPSPPRIARKAGKQGRDCKIHPTAIVEACIIGDRVKIGAYAVVRGSIIGNDAIVEDFAYVQLSVLGEGAAVTFKGVSNMNVLYPGALLGHLGCQMSVLGRDAFVATDSRILDLKFDGNVQVEQKKRSVDSGARFLGACVGHRATVGGGVFVNHGAQIPNDASLVKNPREVFRKIPADHGGKPLMVQDGKAVPFGKGAKRATARGAAAAVGGALHAPDADDEE